MRFKLSKSKRLSFRMAVNVVHAEITANIELLTDDSMTSGRCSHPCGGIDLFIYLG